MSDSETKSDLEQQRHDDDAAQTTKRADADRKTDSRRRLLDSKRQNERGDRQAREGRDRERASDDANRATERSDSDQARVAERKQGDADLARETQARSDSDDALEQRIDLDARRTAALKEVLGLVETQIQVVAESLTQMLAAAPRGADAERMGEGVATIRVASDRMRRLLLDVLDPGDGRRRYHEVGGSG